MTPLAHYATLSIRPTDEDATNLAAVGEAIRKSSRRSFLTASEALRSALRVAAILARGGELDATLARYRADLAGG